MAVNVYYGTCVTEAGTAEKIVRIKDSEITTDNFDFEVGDLLVVYFSNMNSAAAPSLVVTNGDTEEEVSTSNDTGKFVKINSIEEIEDPEGIWDNGETVIFAYTKNVSNNDNVYYWELIDAARATEAVSGVTKLYGTPKTNISEWLASDFEEDDFNKALTPGILKKFYNLLIGSQKEEEEEPAFPTLHLTWFPENPDELELINLGTLSLTSEKDQGIVIKYPLDQRIEDKISTKFKATSDLYNDGHAVDDTEADKDDGKFYITNILPGDRSLYFSDSPTPYEFLIPNNNGNLVLNGKDKIQLNGATGTNITNGLIVDGAINSGDIRCNTIVSGAINAGNNEINTTGKLSGGVIYEGGTKLAEKYSSIICYHDFEYTGIKIPKNSQSGHIQKNISKAGYIPFAVAWFNLNYNKGNPTGDATWCFLWECNIKSDNKTLEFAIRNTKNSAVIINAVFRILYVKKINKI